MSSPCSLPNLETMCILARHCAVNPRYPIVFKFNLVQTLSKITNRKIDKEKNVYPPVAMPSLSDITLLNFSVHDSFSAQGPIKHKQLLLLKMIFKC